jgi:hypothetical protein
VASAYGPAPAALRETGVVFSALQGQGTLLRLYMFPDRFHIEINYPASSENRTMIGDRVWNLHAPANPVSRGAIMLQAVRVALPWSLLSRQSAAVDRGTATGPGGGAVRVVEFPLVMHHTVVVEIDPETGYIVRSRGIQKVGEHEIEFATVYSDFRVEGGRVHAAREDQSAAGTRTGYSLIDKVEYLDAIPDSVFAPWESARGTTWCDARVG